MTIPNSVTSISPSAFEGCSGLVTIVVDESNVIYDSRENCNAIIETASNRLVIGCSNTIIPNSITSIAYSAFSGCSGLNNITIPNSVTSIGMGAFSNCNGLTNVIIPEGITKISPFVFEGCNNLVSVTIPNSVTSIGLGAFSGCCALTSVIIPNSVTNIDGGAFAGCENLASIEIPNSVVNIGSIAFKNTAWYDNQEDGLVYAGNVAYEYKGEMPENTSITIKDGTVSIAYGAFMNCSGLTTLTIPSSVTYISGNILSGCTGLTDVYCYAESVPETDDDYGFGHSGSAYLHVPSSSIAEYKKAWGREFSIIGGFVYDLVELIENGDLEKESQFQYFYSKEMSVDDGALLKSRVVDGEGKDGTKGIVVHSSDIALNPWDNQFYIILPFAIPVGTPIFVEFDYKASNSGTVQTSGHEVIGVGVSNGIGSVEMGTEWNHFKFASAVTSYVYANDIKCIAFDLNYIRQATDFYFDNISFKIFKEDWEVLSNTGAEIIPMEKETEIDFEKSFTEESDLTNLVVENVYVTLDTKTDGYDAEKKCIVLTSTVTAEQVEGISDKEVGEAMVKENFNGLILEVPAGTGTISIDAQTKGNRSLNVKVGNGEAQTFVQPERGKVEIPYTVADDSYVYIYGAATSASAQRRAISSDTENGVLIYGVKWEGVSTGIDAATTANEGTHQFYTIDGTPAKTLQKGVNIVHYSDGTSKKVYMK